MDRRRPGAAATITGTATSATAATAATTQTQHAYQQQDLRRDLDAITATGVPGVLAEVRTDGRELRDTSGVASLDNHAPVNPSGFFRIGSNTKTFISVVVLQHRVLSPADLRPRRRVELLQHQLHPARDDHRKGDS